ncbi:hypothetical protein QL845_001044 [Enterococcus faecium]|nr:hypothetical protein [Enterococcus faecium]
MKWLEAESDRLEKECNENNNPHKTVNHSFLEGFNYALLNAQDLEQIQLDDNQKIVLEWLKEKTCRCNKPVYPMNLVRKVVETMPAVIVNHYDHLSDREEFQVLAAFAQWGLEQEEAE